MNHLPWGEKKKGGHAFFYIVAPVLMTLKLKAALRLKDNRHASFQLVGILQTL